MLILTQSNVEVRYTLSATNLIPIISFYSPFWQAVVTNIFSPRLLCSIRSPLWRESQTILPHWSPTPVRGTAGATLGTCGQCMAVRISAPDQCFYQLSSAELQWALSTQTFPQWQQQGKASKYTQTENKTEKRDREKRKRQYSVLYTCTSPLPLSYYSNILRWPRQLWIQIEMWSSFSFSNLWRRSKIKVLLAILCSYIWSSAVIIIEVFVRH